MKICGACWGNHFHTKGNNLVCDECGAEYQSMESLMNCPEEIPLSNIETGLKTGDVEVVFDDGTFSGITCRIGDYHFYFEGSEAEGLESLDEYWEKCCTPDELPERIYSCIGTVEKAHNNGIGLTEWLYYSSFLSAVTSLENHGRSWLEYKNSKKVQ